MLDFLAVQHRDVDEGRRSAIPYGPADRGGYRLRRTRVRHPRWHVERLCHLLLVVHKPYAWHENEIDGVFDAWGTVSDIERLQVNSDPGWTGVALKPSGSRSRPAPDSWPVTRGSLQCLSGTEALLWVSGTAPNVSLHGKNYNQSVKRLPTPISFRRWSGQGALEVPAKGMLALSKLDWNNDALYGLTPVTVSYSQRLSRMIGRAPALPDDSYQFRPFM